MEDNSAVIVRGDLGSRVLLSSSTAGARATLRAGRQDRRSVRVRLPKLAGFFLFPPFFSPVDFGPPDETVFL